MHVSGSQTPPPHYLCRSEHAPRLPAEIDEPSELTGVEAFNAAQSKWQDSGGFGDQSVQLTMDVGVHIFCVEMVRTFRSPKGCLSLSCGVHTCAGLYRSATVGGRAELDASYDSVPVSLPFPFQLQHSSSSKVRSTLSGIFGGAPEDSWGKGRRQSRVLCIVTASRFGA